MWFEVEEVCGPENVLAIYACMRGISTPALCFLQVQKKKSVTELLLTLNAVSVYEFEC
jgi:hypothetical protein